MNKEEFTANESSDGKCPKCGSENIKYGSFKVEENYIKYPWDCNDCNSEGTEYGNIVFDGHSVDYSPYFQTS